MGGKNCWLVEKERDMLIRIYSDEELMNQLDYYNELGWEDIPDELQKSITSRTLLATKRTPTEQEQWETIADAREHRIMNKELTMKDYMDKYKYNKPFTII